MHARQVAGIERRGADAVVPALGEHDDQEQEDDRDARDADHELHAGRDAHVEEREQSEQHRQDHDPGEPAEVDHACAASTSFRKNPEITITKDVPAANAQLYSHPAMKPTPGPSPCAVYV